jgi:hypothetical protein
MHIHQFETVDRTAVVVLELDFQNTARMHGTDGVKDGCQRHNISSVFEPLGHIVVVSVAHGQQ